MTLQEVWADSLTPCKIIYRLRKTVNGLKEAPWLWHKDINTFLLSLWFTQSLVDPNLYHPSDSILIQLTVDNISLSYLKAAAKAAIQLKVTLSGNYKIMNLSPAHQVLGIKIHHNGTQVSLGPTASIITIIRLFDMVHTHHVLTPSDLDKQLDLANDWEVKEWHDITDYQAVVGSLIEPALATQPYISSVVAGLSCHNSRPFTSHIFAGTRVNHFVKSRTNFRPRFRGNRTGMGIGIGNGIGIGIDIRNSHIGYLDSDWSNYSTDHKSQGGHVLFASNEAMSWQSWKQSLVTLSISDAKLITCSEASRGVQQLLQLEQDICHSQKDSSSSQSSATIMVRSHLSRWESSKFE